MMIETQALNIEYSVYYYQSIKKKKKSHCGTQTISEHYDLRWHYFFNTYNR